MRRIVYNSLLTLLCMAISCNHATAPNFEEEHPTGLHSINYLKSLAHGESTPLQREITIEGIVISDDTYGEFSRALVIEDADGGITLQIAGSRLYRLYPRGTKLRVRCNGLVLYNYGGKVELGATYNAYGSTLLSAGQAEQHLQVLSAELQNPQPRRVCIPNLTPTDIDRYVCIEGVSFLEKGFWCDWDAETNSYRTTEHTIADSEGYSMQVRTLSTADYANEPLPEGNGSLYGIIDYFDGRYLLRIVGRDFRF
ncbi:MAG: hypothetical protein J6R73_08050 [Alistipes sp.]|nr:hypothetical protein [Alistipes sp.]